MYIFMYIICICTPNVHGQVTVGNGKVARPVTGYFTSSSVLLLSSLELSDTTIYEP